MPYLMMLSVSIPFGMKALCEKSSDYQFVIIMMDGKDENDIAYKDILDLNSATLLQI